MWSSIFPPRLFTMLFTKLFSGPRTRSGFSNLSFDTDRCFSSFATGFASSLLVAGFTLAGVQSAAAQTTPEDTAEEAVAACEEAARLWREDQDIVAALEEASWCVEGLQQIKSNRALAMFPDEVDGFIGGELKSQKALGMSMIERDYKRDGKTISITMTGGGGSGAAAGLAGLAALAEMGMNLGAQAGTKFRVQRRTVIDTSENGKANFMVQLRSGGMLTISSSSVDQETAMAFVKAFPIADLDDALKN